MDFQMVWAMSTATGAIGIRAYPQAKRTISSVLTFVVSLSRRMLDPFKGDPIGLLLFFYT